MWRITLPTDDVLVIVVHSQINMAINKKALDATQLEYLAKAEQLQAELIAQGFMATRIEKDENDRCTFKVIFFDGTRDYLITRDYQSNVHVNREEYKFYSNVSSHVRGELYKKYKDGNIKVITAKKLQAKIDAENAYHTEMAALNEGAAIKSEAFINEVKALENEGYSVSWSKGHPSSDERDTITGGSIEHNGIEFNFEISKDGYISKKMKISYTVDATLNNFMLLSDNRHSEI